MAYTRSLKVEKKVEAAARGVLKGYDTIRHQCWECGKDTGPVCKCSCCEAARYCSKECQAKSWKDGHRGACGELKIMYHQCMANYRRIDQGLKLQQEADKEHIFKLDGYAVPPAVPKTTFCFPWS